MGVFEYLNSPNMKESWEQEDLEAVVALTDSAHHQNVTVSVRVDGHTHRDGHLRVADLRVAMDADGDHGKEEWRVVGVINLMLFMSLKGRFYIEKSKIGLVFEIFNLWI
jgi:hypothetical protein